MNERTNSYTSKQLRFSVAKTLQTLKVSRGQWNDAMTVQSNAFDFPSISYVDKFAILVLHQMVSKLLQCFH